MAVCTQTIPFDAAFPTGEPRSSSLCGPELGEMTLRVVCPGHEGQIVRIRSRKCTIGSAAGCTLRIRAAGVGSLHCWILRGPSGVIIRRLHGPATLNGGKFDAAPFRIGDRVRIGSVDLELLDCNQPVPDPQPHFPPLLPSIAVTAELEEKLAVASERVKQLEGESRQGFQSSIVAAERADQLRDALAAAHEQLADARRELTEAQETLKRQAREWESCQEQLNESHDCQSRIAAELEEVRCEAAKLADYQQQLNEARDCQNRVAAELDEIRRAAAAATAEREALLPQLEQARAARVQDEDRWQAEFAQLERRLQQREAELDALRSSPSAQTCSMTAVFDDSSRSELKALNELQAKKAELEEKLAASESALETLGRKAENDAIVAARFEKLAGDFDSQCIALDDARTQAAAANATADRLQRELTEQTAALARQQAELDRRQDDLTQSHHQLVSERNALQAASQQLGVDRQQVEMERERLAVDHEKLQSERQQLAAEQACAAGEREQLAAERERLAAQQTSKSSPGRRKSQNEQRAAQLEQQSAAANERQAELCQERERLAADRAALETQAREIDDRVQQLDQRERELQARASNLDEQANSLRALQQEITAAGEQAQRQAEARPSCAPGADSSVAAVPGQAPTPESLGNVTIRSQDIVPMPLVTGDADSLWTDQPAKGEEGPAEPGNVDSLLGRLVKAGLWRDEGQAAEGRSDDLEYVRPSLPPSTAAAATPASAQAGPVEHEEESIELYMERLLKRVRGEAPHFEATFKSPAPAGAEIAEPCAPIPSVPESSGDTPGEYSPRRTAPEQSADLSAMRSLANSAARSAIDRHVQKHTGRQATGRLFGALLTVAASVILCYWAWKGNSVVAAGGALIGTALGGYWTFSAIHRLRGIKRLNQRPFDDPELSATQSL